MIALLRGFGRQFVAGLLVLAAATVVLGVAYPAAVWALSRITATTADGGIVDDAHGCPAGSLRVGVDLTPPTGQPDGYLHSRLAGGPSDPLTPGDPSASGGSNLGPNSAALVQVVQARRSAIAGREGVDPAAVPADAVTGSGSGLDPAISPAYAELQVPRLARVNQRSPDQVRAIIAQHTRGRQWGVLGAPRVDVLAVNLALGHTVAACPGEDTGSG
ncbi:potassium-transporting ATPase C chain [Gordonia hirsuta DSM 44140 = NBRC 16056]|uniref:Potassium-transporting ATPase KdpC subunit n=1 Tax=Gordonia hirsuta DSM 44140 = NBRC 16056 TaxID=1121927 RepID=L7LC42_9ACTN|nr:potassium-transporting ATPase subunit C [Gordonia hirsuta]GAC58700.1 potassium-transporting ATPase C chain [Gordonia hirsuta DSM 44140 = NBRC 16056]